MQLHRRLDPLFEVRSRRLFFLLLLGLTIAASREFVELVPDLVLPEEVHHDLLLLHELPAVFLVREQDVCRVRHSVPGNEDPVRARLVDHVAAQEVSLLIGGGYQRLQFSRPHRKEQQIVKAVVH